MAGEIAETSNVDGTHLLDKHTGLHTRDVYLGPERSRSSADRRGGYEHHRTRQEGVGLHDDPESPSVLFVARAFGEAQGEDVTPTHAGPP